MKIGIPVEENYMKTNISQSFGRTDYFLIYDTDTEKADFLDNSAANTQGGAGIKAAQRIVDAEVDILITPRCGENAADVLNMANIKIYKNIGNSIEENIQALKDNKLDLLQDIHPGLHNHGSK